MEVTDNMVLLDLGDKNGQLSMVKLYAKEKKNPGDKNVKEIKDLKLVSYHISYSVGVVAFFFIQRNNLKKADLYAPVNISGVNFMVVHEISKLQEWSADFLKGKSKYSIIDHQTRIFIFGRDVKSLVYAKYDRNFITQYQDNSKAASMMANTIVHEMVYDPINPVDNIVPFLFSSEHSRLPTPIFRWFVCFMDLNLV